MTVASELQGAFYPREPAGREAIDADARGWVSVEFDHAFASNVDLASDLILYASQSRRAFIDAEAKVAWRGAKAAIAAGLLRERWGRFADSALDPLGPANTPFSLVRPEQRLSQPTVRVSAFLDDVSVDVYALAGQRRQPVPEGDGRFGFGVTTSDVVHRGALADQALGVRISRTQPAVDWSAHVFGGLSRRPTFVPRFTTDASLAGMDAVYTEILQVGGDMETTRADWRFVAEGFGRRGGVDVTGRTRSYGAVAAAAEYQRLGAFDGAWNIIPRVEFMADTRGDLADIPFASALRAGIRVAATRLRPVQVETGYAFDWAFRGHGVFAAVEKTLAESPTVNVGFETTAFFAGSKRSILDVWKDDLELFAYVRLELSR